jgi:transcriptional regulator GlxA family with amidase domain
VQIAIVLWDKYTALDAVGPYQVLSLVPGAEVRFVAEVAGPVRNEIRSLGMVADASLDEVRSPDIIVVPGGMHYEQMKNERLLDWLREADKTSTWTTSVCTGSVILAAAGLLEGRTATSHWASLEELSPFGATGTSQRVVFDGKYVTAAGVSSGIDMGLALAARLAGDDVAKAIQLLIEYDPEPPFDAGAPHKAPAEIVANVRGMLAAAWQANAG